MDNTDYINCRKELYAKYLDSIRTNIYGKIIELNSELISKLYNKRKNHNLRNNPLWLLHGGELINLYSDNENAVRTKDIDLKLYFTGNYNIPSKLMKKTMNNLPKDNNKKYNHIKSSLGKYFKIWEMGEQQRIKLCTDLLINKNKSLYSQLNIKSGKITDNKSLKDIKTSPTQKWINGDDCSAFIINTPYVTQVGRNNFPYDLSQDIIENLGGYYDEDMDGYYIDDDILENIDIILNDNEIKFKNDSDRKKNYSDELMSIRLKNQKFKLSSVVGIILIYNKTRDEIYIFHEGILDTYIDYSAGEHIQEELEYLGRYSDGSFPSIIKNVKYNGKKGIFKIPSLTWIIYDQLRMLYVVLRGEYKLCNDKKCEWVELGGGAKENYEKYFNKLSGLLISFNNVLKKIKEGNIESIREEIKHCKDTNIEKCGFSVFIASLYENLISQNLKGRTIKKKKTKRKARKSSFIRELELKNSDIYV